MTKNLKILFTLSVLLNVLLGGALAGGASQRANDTPWKDMKSELSPEAQKQVTEMFEQNWKEMSPMFRAAGQERKNMTAIISAENFNEKDFDEAARRMHALQNKITDRKMEATKKLVATLPAEDRKKLAGQIAKSFSMRAYRGRLPHDYPRMPRGDKAEGKDD